MKASQDDPSQSQPWAVQGKARVVFEHKFRPTIVEEDLRLPNGEGRPNAGLRKHRTTVLMLGLCVLALAACGGEGIQGTNGATTRQPTPLGATTTSSVGRTTEMSVAARESQARLRSALAAERLIRTETGSYTEEAAALARVEPTLIYKTGIATSSSDDDVIYVKTFSANVVCLSAKSSMLEVYMVKDIALVGTSYNAEGAVPTTCDDDPLARSEWL